MKLYCNEKCKRAFYKLKKENENKRPPIKICK